MTKLEIFDLLVTYLDQHINDSRGGVGEGNYRFDFFKLFKEAYRNKYLNDNSVPRLHGDAIRDQLIQRVKDSTSDKEKKQRVINQFLTMWDDWRFAWDNYDSQCKEDATDA